MSLRIVPALALAALLLPEPGTAQLASNTPARRSAAAAPAEAPSRVVRGVRIAGELPAVDGRLDDAAWAAAEPATGFVQMRPDPGKPATERTEARVLYSGDAVYVAMRMYDSAPDSVAAQLARRDASGVYSDWAHVLIDSYHDRRTGFRFSVNPRGVKKDVLHYDDTSEDVNWDAVWEVGTRVDSLGWTAEFRIPLSQLRFSGAVDGERVWGVNFSREVARRGEWAWWSPVLPNTAGMVSQSGELHGLAGIRPGRRLELLPYSVGSLTRAPGDGDNPFYRRNDGGVSMGMDLRYGLTSNLTVSATLNPDFGQVEADPSQVNLSAYESYFAEKRPFFMEGSNIFAFGVGTDDGSGEALFYSRRIGRTPQRNVDAGDGWLESPEATTILGAAKVTGKTAGGWTLGLLDAVTGEERARLVEGPGGRIQAEAVEPLTNYFVGSLTRDFRRGGSAVGIMTTATHRRLDGREELGFLRSSAYSAGIKGRHRFAGNTWEANGYVAASHVRGSEEAILRVQESSAHFFQRTDADHVEVDSTRTSLTGTVASFWVGKNGGSKLRGGFGAHLRTPGLELNDLGFMGEADQVQAFTSWSWQQYEPQGVFRSWSVGINPFSMWTTGGERIFTQLGHWGNYELKNFWNGGWWTGRRFEALSNGSLRGGPAIVRPAGLRYSAWVNSDTRKPLRASFDVWGGVDDDGGGWDYGVAPTARYRPSSQLDLSLSPQYRRSHGTWQYVTQDDALGSRRYVMSQLDQTTVTLTTRLNYTISPTLSLELYAQPFVSAGTYRGFKEVMDPRAARFRDRFRPFGQGELSFDSEAGEYRVDLDGDRETDLAFNDPDFNFKQLRSNAVLRWEYRPGSTLFLVWSQGRTDYLSDGSFGFGRDFGRLMGMEDDYSVPATNVLLVKFSYWLNL
ncbi:MAG TPA: DUF5916 domain-containing protein [Longimicrobiaceae bacterium]|nr:DUF5916 domain-containing protein [Longimicrobiaceae bacterium]